MPYPYKPHLSNLKTQVKKNLSLYSSHIKFGRGNSSSLVFLSLKDEVCMDEAISHSPEKYQGELLTIVGYPEVREPCIFGKGMYLSVFYCLCYVKYLYTDMLEDRVS